MNKAIAYPESIYKKLGVRGLVSAIRTSYWVYRCKNLSHRKLLKKTVSVIEDILEAHKLLENFHNNKFSEIRISAEPGLAFEITKSPRENILISLQKNVEFGQLTYDIVLRYHGNEIVGINHMATGFCINSEFQEKDSRTLNPEVLVELMLALPDLILGKPSQIRIANYEQEFHFDVTPAGHNEQNEFLRSEKHLRLCSRESDQDE